MISTVRTIRILSPGMQTTVQDLGREGFGAMGVSASGAADAIALRVGNRLVGNPENAAALEMTLLGGAFEFPQGAVVALTGSNFGATLGESPIEMWSSLQVTPGETLRLGGTRTGARCYLCVQGGIAVTQFLDSSSTHLLSGLGGFEGRALRKGDVLFLGGTGNPACSSRAALSQMRVRRLSGHASQLLTPRKILRVTPGPQIDWFPGEAKELFYASTYRVAEESNRMGLRLEGPALPVNFAGEMISEGVPLGAIQITSAGLPIILFVEQQTTGGYPKIANVISADLPSVGQLRPRDEIRFERIEFDAARALLREQEALLSSKELFES
jgi:antagonist of KipI